MTLARPNAARDIGITEDLLQGAPVARIAKRCGVSSSRACQIFRAVMGDLAHPMRLTEPLPPHDWWLLTDARKHRDFWLRRIEAHKTFLRVTSHRQTK